MKNKEKIKNQLKEFFTTDGVGPEGVPIPLYHDVFKPLIEPKNVDFFIEIFDTNDFVLRAWGFLGIYRLLYRCILYEKEEEMKNIIPLPEFQRILSVLLKDDRKIGDYGGCFLVIHRNLNELFVDYITLLNYEMIYQPVLEFCSSDDTKTDIIVGKLLEGVISKSHDPKMESILIRHAQKVEKTDFKTLEQIIKAFGNLYETIGSFKNKSIVEAIFRDYMKILKHDKSAYPKINGETDYQRQRRTENIRINKKNLRRSIIRNAAIIGLDFIDETVDYIRKEINWGYIIIPDIAKYYRNNEEFKKALLEQLEDKIRIGFTASFIYRALKMILSNWREKVREAISRNPNKLELINELKKFERVS